MYVLIRASSAFFIYPHILRTPGRAVEHSSNTVLVDSLIQPYVPSACAARISMRTVSWVNAWISDIRTISGIGLSQPAATFTIVFYLSSL